MHQSETDRVKNNIEQANRENRRLKAEILDIKANIGFFATGDSI